MKRVLIVDDDPAALEAMSAALKREFQVHQAADSQAADSLLKQEPVDLVILDVVLGGQSGLDFLSGLRKSSDVPVLLVTGFGTKEIVAAAMRLRANDYLDKPFTATQLLERVQELTATGPRPTHIAERIRAFIERQYMHDWTVENLAKALDLSVRTMRQVFRRTYGRQPTEFLEEVRIEKACELLATTDLPIGQVASRVGFRDRHYFTRVFHQRVGKSPRVYRTDQRRDPTLQGGSSQV
jgi:YesN/AraC family two-component response regulator